MRRVRLVRARDLDQQLAVAERRLDDLARKARKATPQNLMQRSLEELRITLAELAAASEQLRDQNEQLAELRKEVEREWQRYLELFQFAPDPYLVTDLAGNILEANQAAAEMLGAPAGRLKGKPLAVFVPEGHRADFRDCLLQMRPARSPATLERRSAKRELVLRSRRGTLVPIELTLVRARDGSGQAPDLRWLLRDVQARKQAEEVLRHAAARLEVTREQERKLIAREIHDELGQALTALRMDLAWVKARLPAEDAKLTEKAVGMLGTIEQTIRTVRRIATDLRPPLLDDLGLVAAIEWQAEQMAARTGVRTTLDLADPRLDDARATTVFRIVQEALTNVARHAGARTVSVRLRGTAKEVTLQVMDDGKGITAAAVNNTRALGLLGMRERALAWGGTLDVRGRRGGGTEVRLCLPRPPDGGAGGGGDENTIKTSET